MLDNPLIVLPLAFILLFLLVYFPPLILTKILSFFAKSEIQKWNIKHVFGPAILFIFVIIMWIVILSSI